MDSAGFKPRQATGPQSVNEALEALIKAQRARVMAKPIPPDAALRGIPVAQPKPISGVLQKPQEPPKAVERSDKSLRAKSTAPAAMVRSKPKGPRRMFAQLDQEATALIIRETKARRWHGADFAMLMTAIHYLDERSQKIRLLQAELGKEAHLTPNTALKAARNLHRLGIFILPVARLSTTEWEVAAWAASRLPDDEREAELERQRRELTDAALAAHQQNMSLTTAGAVPKRPRGRPRKVPLDPANAAAAA